MLDLCRRCAPFIPGKGIPVKRFWIAVLTILLLLISLLKLIQMNIFLMNKFNQLKIFQCGLFIQKMMKLLIFHFILMLLIKDFKMQVQLIFIIVIMIKLLTLVENMM